MKGAQISRLQDGEAGPMYGSMRRHAAEPTAKARGVYSGFDGPTLERRSRCVRRRGEHGRIAAEGARHSLDAGVIVRNAEA